MQEGRLRWRGGGGYYGEKGHKHGRKRGERGEEEGGAGRIATISEVRGIFQLADPFLFIY